MSAFIFGSPLVISALISLWLGWKHRLILFGAWLSTCVGFAMVLLRNAFGDNALSKAGLTLLAALVMFEIAGFGLGLLAQRAQRTRHERRAE